MVADKSITKYAGIAYNCFRIFMFPPTNNLKVDTIDFIYFFLWDPVCWFHICCVHSVVVSGIACWSYSACWGVAYLRQN